MREFLLKSRFKIIFFLDKHLSTETFTYSTIIAIIFPIFVDQAFLTCMNLLNTAMISSAGVNAISAVNMVDSLNIFLLNIFIAVSTGGTVIVAQFKGSGNDDMVNKSAGGAIAGCTVFSTVIAILIIIFNGFIFKFLFGGAEQEVLNNARIYLIGGAISFPAFAIYEAVCGALRGVSDTKSSLGLSIITNLSYVILNIILINIMHLGVMGMIISLIISRIIGMSCSIYYIICLNHSIDLKITDFFKPNFSVIKRIMSVGLPFAAEQMFFNGGKLLTQTFIVTLGTLSMTVNAICGSLIMVIQVGASAMSLSVITVVGQCMGRKNVDDANKYMKLFVIMGTLSLVVGGIIILPFFPLLIKLFSPPAEIIHTIFFILLITSILEPVLWSISFVLPSSLRACGDSKFTSITSMLSMWLFRVVMGYVFGIVLGFGITGVWMAMVAEWAVRGTVFLLRFKSKKWCNHNLIGD